MTVMEDGPLTFILILKSCGVGWWNPGTSFLLYSLPLTSFHLLLIPPSYSSLLPNLLLPPPEGSQKTNQIIHEDISILFCSEKLPGSWWWYCNYSFNLQVQFSKRFEIVLDIETFIVYVELTWTHPGPNLHPTWTLPAPDLDPTWTGA